MTLYERKIKKFLKINKIQAIYLTFRQSCHSIKDAAGAIKTKSEEFIKNICLIDNKNNLIVAIVKGEDKVSILEVGKVLNIEKPRPAKPEEILEKTGYPSGGIPSFGYKATFLIDPLVMEKHFLYTNGGSENTLIKMTPNELAKINRAQIVKIRI